MTLGPEYDQVERPLIDQLISMGWKYTTGNTSDPTATGRESFREVLLREDLRRAIERKNTGVGTLCLITAVQNSADLS